MSINIKNYQLYIFEGPDGVGKTTIINKVHQDLQKQGNESIVFSFPGKKEGTLGKLIYDFHHDPNLFSVSKLSKLSLQALHISAHIDNIENYILPELYTGKIILLDRYWWSTLVYGLSDGINKNALSKLIEVEKIIWANIQPKVVFFITYDTPYREQFAKEKWDKINNHYIELINGEQGNYRIEKLYNNDLSDSVKKILTIIISNQIYT